MPCLSFPNPFSRRSPKNCTSGLRITVLRTWRTRLWVSPRHLADDKAFEKRKETVIHWCGDRKVSEPVEVDGHYITDAKGVRVYEDRIVGTSNPIVMDNTLRSGFEFDKAVGRMETANKVFRVTDPMGFQLEITAANLADILLYAGVKFGVFDGEYIWARHGNNMYLTRADHPDYLAHISPQIDRPMEVGDVVYLGNKTTEMLYCGAYYTYKTFTIEYPDTTTPRSMQDYADRINLYTVNVGDERNLKPVHIFIKYDDKMNQHLHFISKKSIGKHRILSSGHPLPEIFKIGDYGLRIDYRGAAVFETVADTKAFFPTIAQVKKRHGIIDGLDTTYGYKRSYRTIDERKPPTT